MRLIATILLLLVPLRADVTSAADGPLPQPTRPSIVRAVDSGRVAHTPGGVDPVVFGRPLPGVATLPEPQVDPQHARDKAKEILDRREFQRPPKNVGQQALEWLQENIVRILNNLFSGGTGAAATWIIVAIIVGGLAFLIRRLARTVQPDPGVRMAVAVTTRRSADEWRREAEGFEAAGDWKEALRCRFRALVGDLIDRGLLRDVPGRTAGEYRREVRESAPTVGDDFSEAAELFEAAWYGDEPTGPDENARFRALADHVSTTVAS